jgi:transposase
MKNYQQRQEAIARYLLGEKITSITKAFKMSRKWFYKWLDRYNSNPKGDWYVNESTAPHSVLKNINDETEAQIVMIRKELIQEKMAQIGAISIQYEFEKRGIKTLPNVWTINRTIRKNHLNKTPSAHKKVVDYPELFFHTHQMDLVGPRYLKNDGKYYAVNLIDITSHSSFSRAVRTKSSDGIVATLADFWKTHGMPDALQMDNELAFRGSNRHPRSFGSVVRFALSQGVAVIFIPVAEPWRNGIIEKFNDTYQKKFLNAYTFENLENLNEKLKIFIEFHNTNHRYSSQLHKTPNEIKNSQLKPILYNGTLHLPTLKKGIIIPLYQGSVYFIRYIRSDLKLKLPNEVFIVNQNLKYSYVVAEINIEIQTLIIWQNNETIQVFPYELPAIEW